MKEQTVREQFTQAQNRERREAVGKDPYRQTYHLMPPVGWLNDPNGLCEMNDIHHIFYQYTPADAQGEDHRGWGHYTTRDFIQYQEENDPFVPDTIADRKGSYSGSALCKDGTMHLFFTGNNKLDGDYDYIHAGRTHWVLHSKSEDGKTFTPKEVILKNEDFPKNLSNHVRDPKVFEKDGQYWMVLGARTSQDEGEVILLKSEDLVHWHHASTIRPQHPLGYMWECPDLFELDGHWILTICPQGIERSNAGHTEGDSNGWFEVKGDLNQDQIADGFAILDNGFDFYAPQTYEDEEGRRILIAWMGIPHESWTNPTVEKGWQHCLTLPRKLTWKNDTLYQYPIHELQALRDKNFSVDLKADECLTLPSQKMELDLHPQGKNWTIELRKDVSLSYENGMLSMTLGASGYGRGKRTAEVESIDSLQIFSDSSSLEVFINHGQKAMTTRVYDDPSDLRLCVNVPLNGQGWTMNPFVIQEKTEKTDPVISE